MMRFLVFSDSHGRTELMQAAVDAHVGDPELAGIVHLGDGSDDIERVELHGLPLWRVRGNFEDYGFFSSRYADIPTERILTACGYNIMIMHGHRLNVKGGFDRAAAYAARAGADVLMFGHTHEKLEKYLPAGETVQDVMLEKPLYLFNPGAASGYRRSYGLADVTPGGIVLSHAET